MKSFFQQKQVINCKGNLIDLSSPKVMGILNLTPDSFYSQSRVTNLKQIQQRVAQMLSDGADIIDLGAYSSRPGAANITFDEEWERLEPALKNISKEFPQTVFSLDTFRAEIARRAVTDYNISIINDISAGNMDSHMFETVAQLKVPYIIMHMVGNPQDMQQQTQYSHLMKEVFMYFAEKIDTLKKMQIPDVIIDPGFGFSKTLDQNFELLNKLNEFELFERPILVGLSRKSMIYNYFKTSPQECLNGTTVLNTLALTKGATILRVHDVKEAKESVDLYLKTKQFC